MNILETLYFPDTAIQSERQYPLFLLFSKVNIIHLIEPDTGEPEDKADSFMYGKLCQAHTPSPLGDDKDRFLYLINDIKNRKDDYAAQLGHLTLASLSRDTPKGEDAKHQIMSTILGKPSTAIEEPADSTRDKEWHARLVLKIGEILDKEQEDVAKAMIFLEESETDLFDKLKGGDEDDEADNLYKDLLKLKAQLGSPSTESVENRLSAWFTFTSSAPLPKCRIWSTTRTEAAAVLVENHTKAHNVPPKLVAELSLPAVIGGNTETDFQHFSGFSQKSAPLLEEIYPMMLSTSSGLQSDTRYNELVSKWAEMLDENYPEARFGRTTAQFYLFEDSISHYSSKKTTLKNEVGRLLAVISS